MGATAGAAGLDGDIHVAFGEVAPVAMMLGSAGLQQADGGHNQERAR